MNAIVNTIDVGSVNLFSLLNTDGRRLVVYKVRNFIDLVISLLMQGNPSQMYLKGLLGIATELAECVFLNDNTLYPTVRRDCTFIGILDKFNKLQRAEEAYTQVLINRLCMVEQPEESVSLPDQIRTKPNTNNTTTAKPNTNNTTTPNTNNTTTPLCATTST